MSNRVLKNCATCGKEISVQKQHVVKNNFCSRICFGKSRRNRIFKKCEYCKKEILVDKARDGKFKYCSKKCYSLYQKTEKNVLRKRKKILCKECGKEFEIIKYQKNKFCSKKCCQVYFKKNKIGAYNRTKTQLIKKFCKHCNKKFEVWNYRKNTAEFCSTECRNNFRYYHGICPTCGKEINVRNFEKKTYCNQECFAKATDKRKSLFSKSVFNFLKTFKNNVDEEICFNSKNYKYFVDFLIDKKIDIECDGTYWHCDQEVYDEKYFNSKVGLYAKDIWEYDRKRDEILKNNHNLIILRTKEKEWRDNKEMFFKKLKENLNEILQNNIN